MKPIKLFSGVKISDRNGDASKRWFVYYSFFHPVSKKMERVRVYGEINQQVSVKEKRKAAKMLKLATEELLQEGFNPFEKYIPKNGHEILLIGQAIDYVLKVKKKELKGTSYSAYSSRVNKFKTYLEETNMDHRPLADLNKKVVSLYLDQIGLSNRTRNNHLVDIRTTFEKMIDLELLDHNPAARIKKVKQESRKNKPFTKDQIEKVKNLLLESDPQLYLFIQMVAYSFLRPLEVARLQVKHIDLKSKTIRVDTKGKADKTKIIVQVLLPGLKKLNLDNLPQSYFLFTPEGKPGTWKIKDQYKRDYFSELFKKRVKDVLNFGPEYGIYSFRHSFALELYKSFISKGMGSLEAKYKMLPITGHGSVKALENYLRDIGAELPEDYSQHLKNIF